MKDSYVVGKKWTEIVEKCPFLELKFRVLFFQNWKIQLSKTFLIYVLAFDSIKIYTLYESQNDRWNLSFVKDINEVGNKMTRIGSKMTISKSCVLFNRKDFILYSQTSWEMQSIIMTMRTDPRNQWGYQFFRFKFLEETKVTLIKSCGVQIISSSNSMSYHGRRTDTI